MNTTCGRSKGINKAIIEDEETINEEEAKIL